MRSKPTRFTQDSLFIIAEIGNNHEGCLDTAKRLIDEAAIAGADAAKFQIIEPELLISKTQSQRIEQLKKFQFTQEQFFELKQHCDSANIAFAATPFSVRCIDWLQDLVPFVKISSGDNNFYPLLEEVAKTGLPVVLSSGLATISQFTTSVTKLKNYWSRMRLDPDLVLLHCVSAYPVEPTQSGISKMLRLKNIHPLIGYSDHTKGISSALHAISLGATVIEKHFTLDHNYSSFRDHQLSATPAELELLVKTAREIFTIKKSNHDEIQESEKPNIEQLRRSIAASRNLSAGDIIGIEDLVFLRPASGISCSDFEAVLGSRLVKDISKGQFFTFNDFSV